MENVSKINLCFIVLSVLFNGLSLSYSDVNECSMPDVCPANFECQNLPQSYTCQCRGGFKYEIKGKKKDRKCIGKLTHCCCCCYCCCGCFL